MLKLDELALPEDVDVDVLIVDNDSNASSSQVVSSWTSTQGYRAHYVVEGTPGVAHARNRVLKEATGEWLCCIDDDEWPSPQWVVELVETANMHGADGVFAPVLPDPENAAPAWVKESGVLERPRHSTGELMDWRNCRMGNVLVRRELLRSAGGFGIQFNTSGGEDVEAFLRCLRGGARLVWCDDAEVYETVSAARLVPMYFLKRAFRGGRTYATIRAKHDGAKGVTEEVCKGIVLSTLLLPAVAVSPLLGWRRRINIQRRLFGAFGKIASILPRHEHGHYS